MFNPDGVFIGNYRTGIIGEDLNRKFLSGRKEFYPELHALKKVVAQCKKEGSVELFFDLHGHSILKNSFIYGPSLLDFSRFKCNYLPIKSALCLIYFGTTPPNTFAWRHASSKLTRTALRQLEDSSK